MTPTWIYIVLAVLTVWNLWLTVRGKEILPPDPIIAAGENMYEMGRFSELNSLRNENMQLKFKVENKCRGCAVKYEAEATHMTPPPQPHITNTNTFLKLMHQVKDIIVYLNIEPYEESGYRKKEGSE